MNTEAAILGVIVGVLRKGSLSNLARIPFRGAYVFAIPLVLFVVATVLTYRTADEALIRTAVRAMNILLYVVLLLAIVWNRHIREMKLLGLGAFLNFVALTANGGVMPVSRWAAETAGMLEFLERMKGVRHVVMDGGSRFRPLTDIIPVPIPILTTVLSVGDVILAVGIFLLIQRYMCPPTGEANPIEEA